MIILKRIGHICPSLGRNVTPRMLYSTLKEAPKTITLEKEREETIEDSLSTTQTTNLQRTEKQKITEEVEKIAGDYYDERNRALDPEEGFDTPRWRLKFDRLQSRARLEGWLYHKRWLKKLRRQQKSLEMTQEMMPGDLNPQEIPQDRNLGLPTDRTWALSKNVYFFPPNYRDPRDTAQNVQYWRFSMLMLFPLFMLFIWKRKYIFEYLLDKWTFGRAPQTEIDFEKLPPPSTMYDPELIVEDIIPETARPMTGIKLE